MFHSKIFLSLALLLGSAAAFQTAGRSPAQDMIENIDGSSVATSRQEFVQQSALIMAGLVTTSVVAPPEVATARGRATLDQAYDRYTPRIITGGSYYKTELSRMIAKGDYAGIKNALAEPPKKSKQDRAKVDGGTTERAAQAGAFSDARVLVAAELFAATFSESSISAKTKAMKQEVETLRSVVQEMQSLSKQALGEETPSGGLFGMGAKKLGSNEISNRMKTLYLDGGNAYNRYVLAANEGLPVQLKKLPFL